MPRKLISAAAGQWLLENPPPPALGRGSTVARSNYLGTLTVAIEQEFKFEGGSAGFRANSGTGPDLEAIGNEPLHAQPRLCFASVDSIQWRQNSEEYARFPSGTDMGTTAYAFELWWQQPLVPLTVDGPPWSADAELFVLGYRNNNTRVGLGLKYLSEANNEAWPYPSSVRTTGDVEWTVPQEFELFGDGETHQIIEAHDLVTKNNAIVVIDGVPVAESTTGGAIINWESSFAGVTFNGNAGFPDAERSGCTMAYFATYDNGEELTLQKIRELFEVSALDNHNMLELPCWIPLDGENVTVEPVKFQKITMGDVLDSTGCRSGAIPRAQGLKVYFEIEILDQGDSTTAIRPGIRRMITAADVGDQTTVGEDGNEHHFYIDGTDLRVDRATLVHAGATDQSTGRVYGFAIDWGTGDFWVSEDGAWLQGDPNTGTLPSGTLAITTSWAAHVWNNGLDGNAVALLHSKEAQMSYPIPTGFLPWELTAYLIEPEIYGEGRRQFALDSINGQNLYQYKFEGGTPDWLTDTSGNRSDLTETLALSGSNPVDEEPIGCNATVTEPIDQLPDSCFSATTVFSESYEARDARLNGAQSWAPKQTTLGQYLTIDMLETRTVLAVQTQGGAAVAEWVITCNVETSIDGLTFTPIVDGTLTCNTDQNTIVRNDITPVEARFVRFIPQTWQSFMDMRVEIIVTMPQLSYASPDSIRWDVAANGEFRSNDSDLPVGGIINAFEFHFRQYPYTAKTQWSLFDATSNGNITLGTADPTQTRNYPTFHNNFNNTNYWESDWDIAIDDKPHQLMELVSPTDDANGIVVFDGIPIALAAPGGAGSGICQFINTVAGAWSFNGDANDGAAASSNAWFGYCNHLIGNQEVSLFQARQLYEASAIYEDKSVPAGIQDGTILDAQLTASSEFNANLGPEFGRLYSGGGFHWAPLTSTTAEWWKVDFGEEVWVTAHILQGSSQNDNWIQTYKLEYNNDDGVTWTEYNSGEILNGLQGVGVSVQEDETAILNALIPFKARYVRIRPLTWNSFISLRTEFMVKREAPRSRDMLSEPRWLEYDQVNCTVGGTNDKDITNGAVTNNTGGRTCAIPRNGKVYFEILMQLQGDGTAANRVGLRKLTEPNNVGDFPGVVGDAYIADGLGNLLDGTGATITVTGTLGTHATNRVIQIAIDWDTGDWWIGTDNTVWLGIGGAGDPSTGANPLTALDVDTNWAVNSLITTVPGFGSGTWRLVTDSVGLSFAPPTNFRAWEDAIY